LAIFGDGPKLRPGNQVLTPDDDSTTAKHPTNRDFQKDGQKAGIVDLPNQSMSRDEISKKMMPNCFWLK
jgi:hypothetical protein